MTGVPSELLPRVVRVFRPVRVALESTAADTAPCITELPPSYR
jgi:hypothetical protein